MKVLGIAAEQFAAGMKVTVSYFVAANEELEDADAQRILDLARECIGDAGGTSDTGNRRGRGQGNGGAEEGDRDTGSSRRKVAEDQDTGETPRRRNATSAEEPDGSRRTRGSGRASATEESDEKPQRGRRGAATAADDTQEGDSGAERPTSRRRSAASEDAEEQPSRSRGRTSTSEGRSRGAESTDTSDEVDAPRRRGTEPKKISDEDLMKASSATARVTSSRVVMKILEQFGVGEVSKIPQGERQEFLDLCKEARDKAAD